jgi:predicted nucleic acid-binding Zn finger protein
MEVSKSGESYVVNGTKGNYLVSLKDITCSCPHYQHRLQRNRGLCKHLLAVKAYAAGSAEQYDEIIAFLKEHVFIDMKELCVKYPVAVRLAELAEIDINDDNASLPLV